MVLEFDHIDRRTKRKDISLLVQGGYPLATIEADIAKCVVRCANDHRRRTVEELRLAKGSVKSGKLQTISDQRELLPFPSLKAERIWLWSFSPA